MSSQGLRNTAFSSLAAYIEYFFGLLASILTARALLPTDMGIYSLLVWIVATAVVIANAGITMGAIKFIAELRGAGNAEMTAVLVRRLRRMQRVMLLIVSVIVGLVLAFAHQSLAPGVNLWLLTLLVISVVMRAPYMFNIAVLKGHQDFPSIAVVAGISASINLIMVLLAWLQSATLPVFLLIYALSGVVFYAISQWRVSRLIAAAPTVGISLPAELEARLRHHLRVVAFTIVLGTIGSSEIELLSLNLFSDSAHAGLFKVANALAAGIALLVPGVLSAQLLPMMANAYGRGQGEAESRFVAMTAWLFVLGAPLMAFGAVLSGQVIGLLYGKAYALAAPIFSILLVARVASVLGQGSTAYLMSADRQTALMKLTILFTALRFTGAFASTYAFGLSGAVISAMALSLLGSGATIRLAVHVSNTTLPWARLTRISIASMLPAMCCMPVAQSLSPLPALLLGAAIFAVLYPLGLWLLRCLSEEDAGYVRKIASKTSQMLLRRA